MMVSEPLNPLHPLLGLFLPGGEGEISLGQCGCQHAGGFLAWLGIPVYRFQHEITKDLFGTLHNAVSGGIKEVVVPVNEVLWEEFAKHRLVDCRGHGELNTDIAATLADLADFRRHEKSAFRGGAFLGEKAAPPVDDVTEIGSCAPSSPHLVRKAREDAFGEGFIGSGGSIDIKSLLLREVEELIVDAPRLLRGVTMDGKLATAVSPEIILLSPTEGAGHYQEIGSPSTEEILTFFLRLAVGAEQQGA